MVAMILLGGLALVAGLAMSSMIGTWLHYSADWDSVAQQIGGTGFTPGHFIMRIDAVPRSAAMAAQGHAPRQPQGLRRMPVACQLNHGLSAAV